MVELHEIAAAVYLASGIGALLGVVLPAPRMARGGVWGVALGAAIHAAAIASLHSGESAPALTGLAPALSLIAWAGNVFLLLAGLRFRMTGLAAISGPISFLAVFVAARGLTHDAGSDFGTGSMPHAHVLLASTGFALLGLAGMAGVFFLIEHRRIKSKRSITRQPALPSLEALDRVNVISLAVGFPILTLAVLTGMLWLRDARGVLWTGTAHETWCVIAWAIYAGLAAARFIGHQGSRQAAASAVAGSLFLLFAVIGVGWLA